MHKQLNLIAICLSLITYVGVSSLAPVLAAPAPNTPKNGQALEIAPYDHRTRSRGRLPFDLTIRCPRGVARTVFGTAP